MIWIKYFATVACYLAVAVYARRRRKPTSTTPTSQVTPATPEPPSISSCMERITSGESNRSANDLRFIVMMKKGHGRSFRRRHPDLMKSNLAMRTDGSGRDMLMTIVTSQQAESVRKQFSIAT